MRKLKRAQDNFIIRIVVAVARACCPRSSCGRARRRRWCCNSARSRRSAEEPGLKFKIPLIQEVVRYGRAHPSAWIPIRRGDASDDRRLVVDASRATAVNRSGAVAGSGRGVGWRAAPPEDRLSSIPDATIREVLGADQVTSDNDHWRKIGAT